jgi:hypothetical protein
VLARRPFAFALSQALAARQGARQQVQPHLFQPSSAATDFARRTRPYCPPRGPIAGRRAAGRVIGDGQFRDPPDLSRTAGYTKWG